MDENKLKKLREIDYKIVHCCGNCLHAFLSRDGWGTCRKTTYDHLKHIGEDRQLSINAMGHCGEYERRPAVIERLGQFKEFFK